MTLGGMAAAVGLIIDDAIVMIEHIVHRLGLQPDGEGPMTYRRQGEDAPRVEFTAAARRLQSASTLVIFAAAGVPYPG